MMLFPKMYFLISKLTGTSNERSEAVRGLHPKSAPGVHLRLGYEFRPASLSLAEQRTLVGHQTGRTKEVIPELHPQNTIWVHS